MICTNLHGYIGVLGCSEGIPESGIYINDYPGVTLDAAIAIADRENPRGEDYLLKIVNRSYDAAMRDLIMEVSKLGYNFVTQQKRYTQGQVSQIVIPAGTDKEVKLYVCDGRNLKIDSIGVWAFAAGIFTATFTNERETTSTTYDLVEGMNSLTTTVVFTQDTTVTFTSDVDTKQFNYTGCDCLCAGSSIASINAYEFCDMCDIGFDYRMMLTKLFYLKAAILFFQECLTNTNVSQDARKIIDTAKIQLVYLLGGQADQVYVKGEYPQELKAAARMLANDAGKIPCLSCDRTKLIYTTP